VKSLIWTNNRLFGGLLNGTVVEYDLEALTERVGELICVVTNCSIFKILMVEQCGALQ
jgi:hypothetical protein